MADPVRSNLIDFKHGEKLMFAQLQESVAFAALHLLEIKYIPVKVHRRLYIANFDCDVIATVNLHAHECTVTGMQSGRE